MTLLVLGIDVPNNIPKVDANQALLHDLVELLPEFLIYILAFYTLGAFWYAHQKHFQFIKRVDGRLVWINVLGLMFVALIPFTANLAGDYGNLQIGILPMEVNLIIVGLIFYSEWSYISSLPHIMHHELNDLEVAEGKERNSITILLSLAAIALSFFIPAWSAMTYFLAQIIQMSGRYRSRMKH